MSRYFAHFFLPNRLGSQRDTTDMRGDLHHHHHHHQPAVMDHKKNKNRNRSALTNKDAKENSIKIIDYAASSSNYSGLSTCCDGLAPGQASGNEATSLPSIEG
jgi:hypothetical protein